MVIVLTPRLLSNVSYGLRRHGKLRLVSLRYLRRLLLLKQAHNLSVVFWIHQLNE